MELLDFTNLPKNKKSYGRANEYKLPIIYNDELDCITDTHKEFLKTILKERIDKLLN